MQFDRGLALQWLVRLLLAAIVAWAVFRGAVAGTGGEPRSSPLTRVAALRTLNDMFGKAESEAGPRLTLVYFGDSLAMSETPLLSADAAPTKLHRRLGTMMRNAGVGELSDLRLVRVIYPGLSVWSLYYLTDRIIGLRPQFAVIEFNLYNFADFWTKRDHRLVSAMLPLTRWPEVVRLPVGRTGLAMDEWILGRLALGSGAVPWWEFVLGVQVRVGSVYWTTSDGLQQVVGARRLEFRERNRLRQMIETRQGNDPPRATREFSRSMIGRALAGVSADEPALRMLSASLERLKEAQIPALVYVPPYNLDHLGKLGLLEGSRLDETIDRVRDVAVAAGAGFHDAHALLRDPFFHDEMDHLRSKGDADGHGALALDLADAMADDWHRVVPTPR